MIKREAKQHMAIEAWVRHFVKTRNANCKVEIKHARGKDSMPFSELAPHQLDDLVSFAEPSPFIHKFDDVGYRKKPCDIIGVNGGWSFIAIRYDDFIAIISINLWVNISSRKSRKSLTSDQARKVAYDVIEC